MGFKKRGGLVYLYLETAVDFSHSITQNISITSIFT